MTEVNDTEITNQPKSKKTKKFLVFLAVVFLVFAAFFAGVNSSGRVSLEKLGIKVFNQTPPLDLTTVDYGLLWDVLKTVNTDYVDRPVDQKKLMYGAVEGLVRALGDPHSSFLTPSENEEFKDNLNGNFEGIGAEIAVKNERLIVSVPLPNTPASKAGLRRGDFILQIDGQDTFGIEVEEAVSKIRGTKGSTVTLTILHKGESEPIEVKIVRDAIHVDNVRTEVRQVGNKKLAIIELIMFGPGVKDEFSRALAQTASAGTQGIILDLRDNPGGLLDAAIDISSFWLESEQLVLKEVDADKKEYLYQSKGPGQLAETATVVLVNGASASASEIVAGALQDHKLATVVGEKTFGKGSVQDLIEFSQGGALKLTIAKWLTPNGRSIHNQGLEPDVAVELTIDDYNADRDPQMDKAIELLSK